LQQKEEEIRKLKEFVPDISAIIDKRGNTLRPEDCELVPENHLELSYQDWQKKSFEENSVPNVGPGSQSSIEVIK
jgi:hypothetical protein